MTKWFRKELVGATILLVPILLMIPAGFEERVLPSDLVEVDTRGIPIVSMVIEGPGGDLVRVEHKRKDDSIIVVSKPEYLVALMFGSGVCSILLWDVWRQLKRTRKG